MSKLTIVKNKAMSHGATDVGISKNKNKKYYVVYNGKKIHFGHPDYKDYLDHKDNDRRDKYKARASKIKNKQGQYTYKLKSSPNYWAYNILW